MTLDTTIRDDHARATHRAIWALGDYALMAEEVMAPLGPVLVDATGIGPGVRVLDVAAGSGNISLPAAKAGATVVSTDLTPELLQRSQARAAAQGLTLDYREANAHALPFGDGEFDVVMSAIGVQFAPDHQRAAERTGPGLPAGRDDRRDQLDPGRILRPDAGHHPAVPAEPVAGRTAGSAVGT